MLETRFTGGDGLKRTQAYTPEFAEFVLACYTDFLPKHVEPVDDDLETLPTSDVWDTAKLDTVLAFMVQ